MSDSPPICDSKLRGGPWGGAGEGGRPAAFGLCRVIGAFGPSPCGADRGTLMACAAGRGSPVAAFRMAQDRWLWRNPWLGTDLVRHLREAMAPVPEEDL